MPTLEHAGWENLCSSVINCIGTTSETEIVAMVGHLANVHPCHSAHTTTIYISTLWTLLFKWQAINPSKAEVETIWRSHKINQLIRPQSSSALMLKLWSTFHISDWLFPTLALWWIVLATGMETVFRCHIESLIFSKPFLEKKGRNVSFL